MTAPGLTEMVVLTFTNGRRVTTAEHGPVRDWTAVEVVECFDQWGRITDRWHPSNLGGTSLRRKGDTHADWRY